MYIYIHTYIHTPFLHVCTRICVNMHVCTYIHIYTNVKIYYQSQKSSNQIQISKP